ncbi:unnamed protein product, partial [Medioppia subpectinata]
MSKKMTNKSILKALVRKKRIDDQNVGESQLSRCLSLFDLTCLGWILLSSPILESVQHLLRSLLSSL